MQEEKENLTKGNMKKRMEDECGGLQQKPVIIFAYR